jgi:hypothetical protein
MFQVQIRSHHLGGSHRIIDLRAGPLQLLTAWLRIDDPVALDAVLSMIGTLYGCEAVVVVAEELSAELDRARP